MGVVDSKLAGSEEGDFRLGPKILHFNWGLCFGEWFWLVGSASNLYGGGSNLCEKVSNLWRSSLNSCEKVPNLCESRLYSCESGGALCGMVSNSCENPGDSCSSLRGGLLNITSERFESMLISRPLPKIVHLKKVSG